MLAQCDVAIALPGGIGTLDEVFTMASANTIGYHRKKVVLYNMKGFWDKLIALLDDLQARGFIRGRWSECIEVANTLEEIKAALA
jgi:predicted Rossmann-fold nucleotide-binding protein